MGFTEEYMMKLNGNQLTTVLYGDGEFLDYDSNEIYNIYSIKLPFTANGKHITVYGKDDEDIIEDREYFNGKILSFKCNKVDHW